MAVKPYIGVLHHSWLSLTEGRWRWADGTEMALPTSPWHAWYEGEPDNHDDVEHCAVITNYMYWAVRKRTLGEYVWRDFSCLFNNNNIQGYICERKVRLSKGRRVEYRNGGQWICSFRNDHPCANLEYLRDVLISAFTKHF